MEGMIAAMKLDGSVGAVLAGVRRINVYLQEVAPWKLAKEPGNEEKIAACLYTAAECLRVCAALLYPVMPEKMAILRRALGLEDPSPKLDKLASFGVLATGSLTHQPDSLFPRVDLKKLQAEKAPAPQKQKKKETPKKKEMPEGLISFEQVMSVKLKTARILEAEKIEGADKLLKLQVDLGDEQRQLVAGIALHYKPEELVGKTIVVVANLKPAKLRGVKSEGMLLAASKSDVLRLVTVDGDLPVGAAVK
jgi:methionyl-tRNA synthetase